MLTIHGIVNILTGQCFVQEVSREPLDGLTEVTAGPLPPNPAELLSLQRIADFLRRTRDEFDYVLIDTPPTPLVADPSIIATQW